MFQETPLQRYYKNKPLIDSQLQMRIRDLICPAILFLTKTKVKHRIVYDNTFCHENDRAIIFAVNHTRFQDTPIVCQIMHTLLKKRGYIFAGTQKLSLADNVFFFCYGSLFLDRKNEEDRLLREKYKKYCNKKGTELARLAMEEYLKNGRNMIVFPEATWNMSDEKLMLPMRWGIIKIAQSTGAQIIPTILYYDDELMECHVSFSKPMVIEQNADAKREIINLRDNMASIRFSYFREVKRADLDIGKERDKIKSVLTEYPNYDYEYEQSVVYEPL